MLLRRSSLDVCNIEQNIEQNIPETFHQISVYILDFTWTPNVDITIYLCTFTMGLEGWFGHLLLCHSRQGIKDQFQRNARVSTTQDLGKPRASSQELDPIWRAPSFSLDGYPYTQPEQARDYDSEIYQTMQLDVIVFLSFSVLGFIPFHTCR